MYQHQLVGFVLFPSPSGVPASFATAATPRRAWPGSTEPGRGSFFSVAEEWKNGAGSNNQWENHGKTMGKP